jgi:hypothetical protein
MATEIDALIYKNSNTYRLHADNLRWTLLGGFAAFLAALLGLSQAASSPLQLTDPNVAILAFGLSFFYLWILAVQNWFYNLFARWVDDCEARLTAGKPLRTAQAFARSAGPSISPFHPAFFLAEIIVGSVAYFFLSLAIRSASIPWLTPLLQKLSSQGSSLLWLVGFMCYFGILNFVFRRWNRLVWKPILEKLSNLYKPVDIEAA